MERYRRVLQIRIGAMCSVIFVILMMQVFNLLEEIKPSMDLAFGDFVQGFQSGIMVIIDLLFVYLIVRYTVTLKNEEELKRLYCAEYDERAIMIREKSGGYTMFICAIVILVAGVIGAYFNEMIFFSLVGCSVFLFAVRKGLRIYYSRKF